MMVYVELGASLCIAAARINCASATLGLSTVFVFEGGDAVAEIGVNAVNVLERFELG